MKWLTCTLQTGQCHLRQRWETVWIKGAWGDMTTKCNVWSIRVRTWGLSSWFTDGYFLVSSHGRERGGGGGREREVANSVGSSTPMTSSKPTQLALKGPAFKYCHIGVSGFHIWVWAGHAHSVHSSMSGLDLGLSALTIHLSFFLTEV